MKISISNPPNIEEIQKAFNLTGRDIIFTYGDTIYNPGGGYVDPPLETHEGTHSRQQGGDPQEWWGRYLVDVDLRLSQEVEAYKAQYKHYKNTGHTKKQCSSFLDTLAKSLSGPIYGNCVNFKTARKLIRV